jgi:hypothetical protein
MLLQATQPLDVAPLLARKSANSRQPSYAIDEVLACFVLGRHLEPTEPDRRKYLLQAAEIFKRLGAKDNLHHVNSLIDDPEVAQH